MKDLNDEILMLPNIYYIHKFGIYLLYILLIFFLLLVYMKKYLFFRSNFVTNNYIFKSIIRNMHLFSNFFYIAKLFI